MASNLLDNKFNDPSYIFAFLKLYFKINFPFLNLNREFIGGMLSILLEYSNSNFVVKIDGDRLWYGILLYKINKENLYKSLISNCTYKNEELNLKYLSKSTLDRMIEQLQFLIPLFKEEIDNWKKQNDTYRFFTFEEIITLTDNEFLDTEVRSNSSDVLSFLKKLFN